MTLNPEFAKKYGPWALVTGAGQGIGAAYAERLGEIGLSVILLDVDSDLVEAQAQKVRATGAEARVVVCDLADTTALQAAIDGLADLEIGLLVANAGIGAVGLWLDVPIETKLTQVAVNCASLVTLAHRLTPLMVTRRRGGVIIMASGAAESGSSFITTYAATKAFDRVFAEGLWLELRQYGIDVTAVMPGSVDTPGLAATNPKPTRAKPIDPRVVVDAAIEGLGSKINVHPGSPVASAVMSAMRVVPRKALLNLVDKGVRTMYERPAR
jgi:short-subunit dehydrogenase